jgi:hypothetical protein
MGITPVVGNRFNRNYIGVGASNIVVNAILVANKFESTSNLNVNFFNSSYAGIRFKNCPAAVIGLTVPNPAYRNTFINQDFGVKLNKSTVNIGLSGFYNNFYGVNADSSKVWIQGANTGMRSNFSQQELIDIKTTHSALNVSLCNLDSCGFSCIRSEMNNSLEQVYIHDNNMIMSSQWPNTGKFGVFIDRSMFGQNDNFTNIIKRNNIPIQGFGGCPMASNTLTGNMPTEKLVSYFTSIKEITNINSLSFESSYNEALKLFSAFH